MAKNIKTSYTSSSHQYNIIFIFYPIYTGKTSIHSHYTHTNTFHTHHQIYKYVTIDIVCRDENEKNNRKYTIFIGKLNEDVIVQ